MLKVFIGYDPREASAYHVFAHSLITKASQPIAVIPLIQSQLRDLGLYTRPPDEKAATEFSLTRFLVPALCDYEGLAIFADCDMLAMGNVAELVALVERHQEHIKKVQAAQKRIGGPGCPTDVVWCCMHDYTPKHAVKMDGQPNAAYPRKNWSSFMVFDCARCTMLTPEYVNSATPAQLHRFEWAGDSVGGLPLEWNWLVGEYPPNPDAKILHYTEGGPWFKETVDCDHRNDWLAEWYRLELPVRMAQGAFA